MKLDPAFVGQQHLLSASLVAKVAAMAAVSAAAIAAATLAAAIPVATLAVATTSQPTKNLSNPYLIPSPAHLPSTRTTS